MGLSRRSCSETNCYAVGKNTNWFAMCLQVEIKQIRKWDVLCLYDKYLCSLFINNTSSSSSSSKCLPFFRPPSITPYLFHACPTGFFTGPTLSLDSNPCLLSIYLFCAPTISHSHIHNQTCLQQSVNHRPRVTIKPGIEHIIRSFEANHPQDFPEILSLGALLSLNYLTTGLVVCALANVFPATSVYPHDYAYFPRMSL